MVIFHFKFDFVTYIPQFLNLFGAQQNQIGVKKRSKLPISLKSNSQMHHTCICRSFLKEIRWCHSFLTKYYIRPLWGPPGSYGVKRCLHVQVCICISTLFRTKTSWCQCMGLFDIISVLNKIYAMLGHLFRILRVVCNVAIFNVKL